MSSSANTTNLNLPRLELPSWLPPPVAEQAERLYDLTLQLDPNYRRPDLIKRTDLLVEKFKSQYPLLARKFAEHERPFSQEQRSRVIASLKLLCRLTSHKRMDRVWRELYRRRLGSNEFLNPVKRKSLILEKLTTLHDPKNQDMALQAFLYYAFLLAGGGPPLITRAEVDAKRGSFAFMTLRLREDAQRLRTLGLDEHATNLEAAAMDCQKKKSACEAEDIFVPLVQRSGGNPVVRGFILALSRICFAGFEKGLTGTVATTASVALSKGIKEGQVRDIVRAHYPGANYPLKPE